MLKFQALFVIASLALTLYSFIDCAKRDESLIQKLPKWGWLLIILFFLAFGSIAYLFIGRTRRDKGARALYISLLVSAHLFALLTFEPFALLTLLALPLSASLARSVWAGTTGAALIPLLAKTGKLQMLFAALFALGLVL